MIALFIVGLIASALAVFGVAVAYSEHAINEFHALCFVAALLLLWRKCTQRIGS